MTAAEADRLALLVQARWPYPEFTDVDLVVWREDLRAVPYRIALRALDLLRDAGRERQPRSPAVLEAVAEIRASQEGRPVIEPHPAVLEAERRALAALEEAARQERSPRSLRGPLADLVARALPQPPEAT